MAQNPKFIEFQAIVLGRAPENPQKISGIRVNVSARNKTTKEWSSPVTAMVEPSLNMDGFTFGLQINVTTSVLSTVRVPSVGFGISLDACDMIKLDFTPSPISGAIAIANFRASLS